MIGSEYVWGVSGGLRDCEGYRNKKRSLKQMKLHLMISSHNLFKYTYKIKQPKHLNV